MIEPEQELSIITYDQKKIACSYCKKKHVACNGGRPCDNCTKRGIGKFCEDSIRRKIGRPPKSAYTKPSIETSNCSLKRRTTSYPPPILIPFSTSTSANSITLNSNTNPPDIQLTSISEKNTSGSLSNFSTISNLESSDPIIGNSFEDISLEQAFQFVSIDSPTLNSKLKSDALENRKLSDDIIYETYNYLTDPPPTQAFEQ